MTEPGPVLPEQHVWRALAAVLESGHRCVLAVVVDHTGSSPGRTGWLMAVGPDGWLAGTTGGGIPEDAVVRRAVALLAEADPDPVRLVQTHRPDAAHPSGLVCGGEQVVALVPIGPSALAGIRALDTVLTGGGTFDWRITGTGWVPGAPADASAVAEDERASYSQVSGPTHRVVLVGAGHVGAALARASVRLGFAVTIIDERPGAADRLSGLAHRTLTRPYETLAAVVPAGDRTYVVIATPDPERDVAAATALAGVALGYVGMLGSRAKVHRLRGLPGLEAPAGIRIGSHTAEEIAVSVAARLVARRHETVGDRVPPPAGP